ncbi:MAG TPA: RnfABCDGE type electron transport complex subunit G [Clostridiales bacterium]|nr:RnfABCDGE type electron transport complex subunit G [Clostridiales bacterium]
MPETLKLGLKLLIITVVATFALALTQMVTEEPIRVQAEKAANEARSEVLEGADEFTPVDIPDGTYPNVLEVHKGLMNGETRGYTIKTSSKGYGGDLIVIVGIDANGTISGVRITQHSETPGLGAKAQEPAFYEQFSGKSAGSELRLGDAGIAAISGATISSRAVTAAVNYAIEFYNAELAAGGGN